METLLSKTNFIHALSGASGSVFALTMCYPLDNLRTRLQVDDHPKLNSGDLNFLKSTLRTVKTILQKEGCLGFYRGWYAVITSVYVSNFVYFYSYTYLKLRYPLLANSAHLRDITVAFLAGVVNVLVTTPLWVANMRIKLQGTEHSKQKTQYTGVIDCLLKIVQQEGPMALWSGVIASILLATNPALNFALYEGLKRHLQTIFRSDDLPSVMYFLIGGISKTISTLITYPLQVVQTRSRAGKDCTNGEKIKRKGIIQCLLELIRTRGLVGMYKGLETKLLQTVLTTALMFVFYEKIVTGILWLTAVKL